MSTIVLRSVKGTPLTNTEVDNNFNNLNTDKLEAATTATLTNKTINLTSNTLVATSAQLAAALTDETGSGAAVFATSPTLVTPALGTPASGVVTNLTGTASININGTVGATTATTGAFTTLAASGAVTLSGGTANGVVYANGSKVLTSGSALTFDGTKFTQTVSTTAAAGLAEFKNSASNAQTGNVVAANDAGTSLRMQVFGSAAGSYGMLSAGSPVLFTSASDLNFVADNASGVIKFGLNAASEQMRLTSTGLGIGTSSPGAKLEVSTGASALDATSLILSNSYNNYAAPYNGSTSILAKGYSYQAFSQQNIGQIQFALDNAFDSGWASSIRLYTSNSRGTVTERMRLDSSGNLGLGVTPSAWTGNVRALQIGRSGVFAGHADVNLGYFGANWYFDGTFNRYINSAYASRFISNGTSGAFEWQIAPSGTAGNAITFTQAMTLSAAGQLLVGTTTAGVGGSGNTIYTAKGNADTYASIIASGNEELLLASQSGITKVGAFSNHPLLLITNNTERARIDSSGNLGLGVTPSAWASGQGAMQFKSGGISVWALSGSNGYVYANAYYDGATNRYVNNGTACSYAINNSTGQHAWFIAASGTAGNAISFTQAMTLGSDGNLAVGTTTTSGARLVVFHPNTSIGGTTTNGGIILRDVGGFSANNTIEVHVRANSGKSGYLTFTEDAVADRWSVGVQNGSDALRFISGSIGGSERMRLDGSGNLLVGVTSTQGGGGSCIARSGNGAQALQMLHSGTNPFGAFINYTGAAPNGTGNSFIQCNDSAAERFTVRSNGGIANYSGNNVNLSDRREKTNLAPAKSYLDTICAIPVQTFNYIDQNMEEDGGLTLGVVAQDVQAVAPELVMESNWGTKDEPKMRLSIYQTDLQYALMKALQELKAEFDAYKATHP